MPLTVHEGGGVRTHWAVAGSHTRPCGQGCIALHWATQVPLMQTLPLAHAAFMPHCGGGVLQVRVAASQRWPIGQSESAAQPELHTLLRQVWPIGHATTPPQPVAHEPFTHAEPAGQFAHWGGRGWHVPTQLVLPAMQGG